MHAHGGLGDVEAPEELQDVLGSRVERQPPQPNDALGGRRRSPSLRWWWRRRPHALHRYMAGLLIILRAHVCAYPRSLYGLAIPMQPNCAPLMAPWLAELEGTESLHIMIKLCGGNTTPTHAYVAVKSDQLIRTVHSWLKCDGSIRTGTPHV